MSLPDTKIQEKLSVAYFSAVVSYAGYSIFEAQPGCDFGIDFQVNEVTKFDDSYIDAGTLFSVQLKATYNVEIIDRNIIYDLSISAYKRIMMKGIQERILVLFIMPGEKLNWLKCQRDGLSIHDCAFYIRSRNLPKGKEKNKRSVRIKIPMENIFNSETVSNIAIEGLQKIRDFEER